MPSHRRASTGTRSGRRGGLALLLACWSVSSWAQELEYQVIPADRPSAGGSAVTAADTRRQALEQVVVVPYASAAGNTELVVGTSGLSGHSGGEDEVFARIQQAPVAVSAPRRCLLDAEAGCAPGEEVAALPVRQESQAD